MNGWWNGWWNVALGVLAAGLTAWLALVGMLLCLRPEGPVLREALRMLPDVVRLVRRLAGDRDLPTAVRVRLWLLVAYLAMPIDVVPDVIPVLGYADDAIVVVVVLRSVARRAGPEVLQRHWPGTEDGFAALCRLAGLGRPANPPTSGVADA